MSVAQHTDQATTEQARKAGDAIRDVTGKATDQAAEVIAINQETLNRTADLQEKATGSAQQVMQISIETMTRNAREISDQLGQALGFGGADGERLAGQSRQNVEAIARCGTVLSQACQDAWLSAVELGRKRWQHNIENMNRLSRARSVQEFAMLQSEMVREGLQNLVHDTRTVTETSLRAVEEAGRICSSVQPSAR